MTVSEPVKQVIKDHAIAHVATEHQLDASEFHLYLLEDVVPDGCELRLPHTDATVRVSKGAVLVVADLAPEANWGHPVAHLTYDVDSGEHLESVVHTFPIDDFWSHPEKFEVIHKTIPQP